jgi:hypothetical protein
MRNGLDRREEYAEDVKVAQEMPKSWDTNRIILGLKDSGTGLKPPRAKIDILWKEVFVIS